MQEPMSQDCLAEKKRWELLLLAKCNDKLIFLLKSKTVNETAGWPFLSLNGPFSLFLHRSTAQSLKSFAIDTTTQPKGLLAQFFFSLSLVHWSSFIRFVTDGSWGTSQCVPSQAHSPTEKTPRCVFSLQSCLVRGGHGLAWCLLFYSTIYL